MVLLVAVLCLWAIFAVALNFLGIDIYWPFYVAREEPIPHHRLLTARNGVFLTFAFYGLMFLRNSYEKVYPIHFLKMYLLMTAIAGSWYISNWKSTLLKRFSVWLSSSSAVSLFILVLSSVTGDILLRTNRVIVGLNFGRRGRAEISLYRPMSHLLIVVDPAHSIQSPGPVYRHSH